MLIVIKSSNKTWFNGVIYVENIQTWTDDIQKACTEKAQARVTGAFEIELRLIGVSATLGELEPQSTRPHEVGVLGIVTAETEELSIEVAKMLNPYLLHHPLTEQEEMPTFAFPFSPNEMRRGEIYEFCLNHVLVLEDPMDVFHLTVLEIGR